MSWFQYGTFNIYYEEQGTGEPVLLLTGFGDRIEGHTPLRNALAHSGYRVIAADIPGSGRSQPQPRKFPATFYEDDARLFTALLHQLRAEPAHLLGWSTGGDIALLMAALSPALARSIMVWGSAGQILDPTGEKRAIMDNIIDNPIPPLQGYSQYLIATYGADNARATIQSQDAAITEIIDKHGGDISFSKLNSVSCPALLITGQHDFLSPPDLVAQAANRLPNGHLLVAENAGHDVHEARPEWFVQTVVHWLKTGETESAVHA